MDVESFPRGIRAIGDRVLCNKRHSSVYDFLIIQTVSFPTCVEMWTYSMRIYRKCFGSLYSSRSNWHSSIKRYPIRKLAIYRGLMALSHVIRYVFSAVW
jgi:hypothetical protein